MTPFTRLHAIAVPLMRANIDTDQIIRIDRMVGNPRDQLGPYCMEAWRFLADGSDNPEFAPNTPRHRGSEILVAAENFGCGSSREHAVWALVGWGIRAVIAPSFGDIFHANCLQNGLLPVIMEEGEAGKLAVWLEAHPGAHVGVDLGAQTATLPYGVIVSFAIDGVRKEQMLKGLDDIGITLQYAARIQVFEEGYRQRRPWLFRAEADLLANRKPQEGGAT